MEVIEIDARFDGERTGKDKEKSRRNFKSFLKNRVIGGVVF